MNSSKFEKIPGTGSAVSAVVALLVATCSSPIFAKEHPLLTMNDFSRLANSVVAHHYFTAIVDRTFESSCYFDPKVRDTMRCEWIMDKKGTARHQLRNSTRTNSKKSCKMAGGRRCVLFWRNETLRFERLAPNQLKRLKLALGKLPGYSTEAKPLPEGAGVSDKLRERFPEYEKYYKKRVKQYRKHNPHYAICDNGKEAFASFYMQGPLTRASDVRKMCILKCKLLSTASSNPGTCNVIYADGRFASAAAEKSMAEKEETE